MKNEGFNVNIYLDKETGFMMGGNQHNCGTWMDKMGSSDKTGNKGIPATPRDGAPIELVAMQYSALKFMEELSDQGIIVEKGVTLADGVTFWTYKDWSDKIRDNFELCFWIPVDADEDKDHVIGKGLVNRRGIYKDVFNATHSFT
jgi:glycogen debranching enzyme